MTLVTLLQLPIMWVTMCKFFKYSRRTIFQHVYWVCSFSCSLNLHPFLSSGDVAGMGSDLFGSFAESTCAALVLGAGIGSVGGWNAMVFPIVVSAVGLFVCLICSFLATHIRTVKSESQVEEALKLQLISTTILMIPSVYAAAILYLPGEFTLESTVGKKVLTLHPWEAWLCIVMGAVGGLIIGLVTEYYTSHSYAPVREVANSCKTGAATNMIYGIALGYKSAIIPVLVLAVVIYGAFALCDMYGVALAAIGFLSNLATGLTIDVYGPVCDNAGVSACSLFC
jgi:H+-translocating diphosphatase